MRRAILLLLVFVALLAIPSVVRYLNYYTLSPPERAVVPVYNAAAAAAPVSTPPAADFTDEPEVGEGTILLDMAHNNAFELDELGHLQGRLAARGFDVIPYSGGNLAAQLRTANAFVVITPLEAFSPTEQQAVRTFVAQGGKLLLVGDPTRYEIVLEEDEFSIDVSLGDDEIPLNSLAADFDMMYRGDYLYNMTENEGNFRNIVLAGTGLADQLVSEGLEQIVFYGAHSLDTGPAAEVLLAGDDNTWSSATDRPGGLTLAATGQQGRVIAVTDIHFMTEPYRTSYDNGRFVTLLADFLTEAGAAKFGLADFPYFFTKPVDLVYTGAPDLGPAAFGQVIGLQDAFRAVDKEISLATAGAVGAEVMYLGLYNQAGEDVVEIMAANGITWTIEPPILTAAQLAEQAAEEMPTEETPEAAATAEAVDETTEPESDALTDDDKAADDEPESVRLLHTPVGNVQMSGTALILFDQSGGNQTLTVLAASGEGLDNTVALLQALIPLDVEMALSNCVLQGNLALCPTHIADEEVEAELQTDGLSESEEEPPDALEDEAASDPDAESDAQLPEGVLQGSIALGETVEAELAENERHIWTFAEGPTVIDITLSGDEDMDPVLELYDEAGEQIRTVDSTFTGETEEIIGFELDEDSTVAILVRNFFDEGGTYTLAVTESDEETASPIENIFIFVDDNGEPISSGFDSSQRLVELLSSDYEVQTWVASVDGSLQEDTLQDTDLLIWDTGDYQNEELYSGDDVYTIFAFLDLGNPVFVTGSAPGLFPTSGLASLSDLEVFENDAGLLAELSPGTVIELSESYDVALPDAGLTEDETSELVMLRGPASESSGDGIAFTMQDSFTQQQFVLLFVPFVALPDDIQVPLLQDMLIWFDEE